MLVINVLHSLRCCRYVVTVMVGDAKVLISFLSRKKTGCFFHGFGKGYLLGGEKLSFWVPKAMLLGGKSITFLKPFVSCCFSVGYFMPEKKALAEPNLRKRSRRMGIWRLSLVTKKRTISFSFLPSFSIYEMT